jgi:hypothetical protein
MVLHRHRFLSFSALTAATLTAAYPLNCIGVLQNNLEVMLAPMAGNTWQLIPTSWVYQVFGPAMWNLFRGLWS